MPIDPDAQRLLDLIKEMGRPPFDTLTAQEARETYLKSKAVMQPPPAEVAEVRDLSCPGPGGAIALRAYRGLGTEDTLLPCLVYLHGGGWVIGDIDTHDGVCRAIANAAGCRVISVDYRLAPEHKFPAAVDDCAAAYAWVHANAAALKVDAAKVAVGGDSAGGNLAAVLALMGRDGVLPAASFQLLLYPATDLVAGQASYARVSDGFPLVARTMKWFRDHYVRGVADHTDWRASPLRAASLAGTPPAFVLTVGLDPLCDEGLHYARRLEEDGVRVAQLHLPDQIHGFLTMGAFIRAAGLVTPYLGQVLRHGWGQQA